MSHNTKFHTLFYTQAHSHSYIHTHSLFLPHTFISVHSVTHKLTHTAIVSDTLTLSPHAFAHKISTTQITHSLYNTL